ncbi:solute carrier family 45 member 4-like [Diaphorina citri]|uniref:Solute carrier family 45 member 4-like n=1 Tax=Diaphorina citri TaxID=121845 RepID=A0A3Q0J2W8_DIACI|nr:solute carrier family 45 member 4-like [Diaphorina citri]
MSVVTLLSLGVFFGLILVPNGKDIGHLLGDYYPSLDLNTTLVSGTDIVHPGEVISDADYPHPWGIFFTILGTVLLDFSADASQSPARAYLLDITIKDDHARGLSTFTIMAGLGGFMGYALGGIDWDNTFIGEMLGGHVRAVFTVITVLFVICVSATLTAFPELPLDEIEKGIGFADLVLIPDDHARGLSTFTIMAGLGGFMGYALGGIDWDNTFIGEMLGGHVRAVFTVITVLFVICVSATLTAFPELPLDEIEKGIGFADLKEDLKENSKIKPEDGSYGTLKPDEVEETSFSQNGSTSGVPKPSGVPKEVEGRKFKPPIPPDIILPDVEEAPPSLKQYIVSIFQLPYSLRVLCATNLFCWMAHVCYSLYFTDFVGESVFGGDPMAPPESESHALYEEGVRFGCWGMSMYSLSCACYSTIIDKLIQRFRAKNVYVGGLLFYSTGMMLMALTKHKVRVVLFITHSLFTLYSFLFLSFQFEISPEGDPLPSTQIRGLGTDLAIVQAMVFLAQFSLSLCLGTIISVAGTTTVVVVVASSLAFCGALTATKVLYLDL